MAIINLGDISVDSSTSQCLIKNVRSNLMLVPLVLISDREDIDEIVSAVRAGASGFIPTSTEPDVAVRALTFIMGGGSFFPPTALMDRRYGIRFGTDDELDFAHFWHFGCGTKPLKMLISVGWHKIFLHVQALDSGSSNGQECRRGPR